MYRNGAVLHCIYNGAEKLALYFWVLLYFCHRAAGYGMNLLVLNHSILKDIFNKSDFVNSNFMKGDVSVVTASYIQSIAP